MKSRYIFFGLVFGFVLSRAGATEFDAILGMFRLTDLHLFGVIGVAVATAALGFAAFRRGMVHAKGGGDVHLTAKPMSKGLVHGGLLFGVGWAVTGTCPGTALAQIGEGHLAGLFTFAGVLLGVWLHSLSQAPMSASTGRGASKLGRLGHVGKTAG
ncbi:MAG: DUF6691 family protein [Polyangiaceae bacterium]|nr:DUF6691 family protein [Polyangiaceae bacterium]